MTKRNANSAIVIPSTRSSDRRIMSTGECWDHLCRSPLSARRTCGTLISLTTEGSTRSSCIRFSRVGVALVSRKKKNAAGTHSWSLRRSIMVATSVATFMLDATESQRATVAGICAIQRSMGMNPRDDSLLTVNYALGQTGSLYKSPYEVAQDLTAVDLIYETTLYAEIVEDLMRRIAAWIEAAYGLPWGDVWALVRAFAPTMIKLYCVDACPALIQTPCVRRPRADSPPHLGPSEPLARAYSQSIADELRFSEDQRGAESP